LKNYVFLVYMYYMHPGYRTSMFGKNRAYYIQISTVNIIQYSICHKLLLKFAKIIRFAHAFKRYKQTYALVHCFWTTWYINYTRKS